MKCNKNGFANIIIGYGATTGIGGGGGSCIGPHIKLIKGDCPLLLVHCTLLLAYYPLVLAQKYYSTGPVHYSTTCNTFHTAAYPQSTNITTNTFTLLLFLQSYSPFIQHAPAPIITHKYHPFQVPFRCPSFIWKVVLQNILLQSKSNANSLFST